MEIDALFERLEDKNPSIDKVAMAKIVAYIRKLEARILTYEDGIKKAEKALDSAPTPDLYKHLSKALQKAFKESKKSID